MCCVLMIFHLKGLYIDVMSIFALEIELMYIFRKSLKDVLYRVKWYP